MQEEEDEQFYRVYATYHKGGSGKACEMLKEMVECIAYLACKNAGKKVKYILRKSAVLGTEPNLDECPKAAPPKKRKKKKNKKIAEEDDDEEGEADGDSKGGKAAGGGAAAAGAAAATPRQPADPTTLTLDARNVCSVHQGGAVSYVANMFQSGMWNSRLES